MKQEVLEYVFYYGIMPGLCLQSLGNMQVSSILKPSEPSKKQKVSHRLPWDSIMGNISFFIVIGVVLISVDVS